MAAQFRQRLVKTGERRNVLLTSDDRRSNSATVSGKMIRKRHVCPRVSIGVKWRQLISMETDKTKLRNLVLSALRSRDLESAHAYAQQLKNIEARKHPEWEHRRFGRLRGIDHLKLVLSCRPQILESVSDEVLEHLRFAAGVSSLLGVTRYRDYLPSGFMTGLFMDNDSAVRMLLFRASHECDMAYARLAKAERVRFMAANWAAGFSGVCENCKALHGQEWKLEEAPEIPFKHCEARTGCRCSLVPVPPSEA